jgi:hypothetical protein
LKFLDESKAKQTLYNQNSEYIKEEVTRLTQGIYSLKGKLNTESIEKEIVLSSSGTCLRALPEKARNSS